MSFVIFRFLEKNLPGFNILYPVTQRRLTRTVIAFVDDADFFIGGDIIIERAQRLVIKYNKLHSASAGKGQLAKNNFYFWRTLINKYGEMEFQRMHDKIYVKHTEIKSLPLYTPIKSLGIISTPTNNWESQFQMILEKMDTVIKKVTITSILPHEVSLFFYSYLIKFVLFGAGVIRL